MNVCVNYYGLTTCWNNNKKNLENIYIPADWRKTLDAVSCLFFIRFGKMTSNEICSSKNTSTLSDSIIFSISIFWQTIVNFFSNYTVYIFLFVLIENFLLNIRTLKERTAKLFSLEKNWKIKNQVQN
jgi:hypothetical protein